jgi:hypothetical protein
MPTDHERNLQRLDALFNGCPRTVVPWKSATLAKGRAASDREVIRSILASRVVLTEVDPTCLRASQPFILLEHVRYYLGLEWEHTGRTSADGSSALNRFPLVLPDQRGSLRIVAGHHRAAAALITGRPLLARTRAGDVTEPTALTPTQHVEPGEDLKVARHNLRMRGLTEAEILFAFRVAQLSPT